MTKFSSCQVCKKHLYDLSAISAKCPQYGTLQRMAECSHEASIKLCILHKDNQLWLTPFRTEILKLLKPNSLTPHNTKEGIEDAIMNLQDITIKYNISKILSLTFCWPKAMKKQTNSQACPCLVYSIHDTPYKLRTIPATSIPPQKQ